VNKAAVAKTMKILLIMFAPYRTVQMQIAALSAFLKKCGHEVRYLEIVVFSGDTFDEYKDVVKQEMKVSQPDLVGFSSYDMNCYFILDCANFIKNYYPKTKIIVGGHHASMAPEFYMRKESIDYVCIGEGEYVLGELLESLSEGNGARSIKGLCLRDSTRKIIYNGARELEADLDGLPFIDRSVVNSQQLELDYLPMFAGKGCPYSCTYCANNSIKRLYPNPNKYVRYRSPEEIIEEIKECKNIYEFNYVFFYDDIFALNYKWLQRFGELYARNFPDIPFQCLLRPEIAANEKYIKLLHDSGCRYVYIGVESGSEKYRQNVLGRNMTNRTILKGARLIKKYQMKLYIFMMVGLPGETILDMIKSLWLNFVIGAKGVQTGIYYPIENTPLYKYCADRNLINEERRKRMYVFTYDTCLNYSIPRRALIILSKWLNSGIPLIRSFQLFLVPYFLRIQYKKWRKKEIDFKNKIS